MGMSHFFELAVKVTPNPIAAPVPTLGEQLTLKQAELVRLEAQKNCLQKVYEKATVIAQSYQTVILNKAYSNEQKLPYQQWLEANSPTLKNYENEIEALTVKIGQTQQVITALELEIEAHQPPGPSL